MAEIRRVRSGEWRELRELRLEALQESPNAFWERYEEALGRTDDDWREWTIMACHVAVEGGHLVGMVAAVRLDDDPERVDLVAMFVSRAARGRGIGARLVGAQLGWARDEGFTRVGLVVNVENESAYRLYGRHGFRDTGRREPLREGPEIIAEMGLRGREAGVVRQRPFARGA